MSHRIVICENTHKCKVTCLHKEPHEESTGECTHLSCNPIDIRYDGAIKGSLCINPFIYQMRRGIEKSEQEKRDKSAKLSS